MKITLEISFNTAQRIHYGASLMTDKINYDRRKQGKLLPVGTISDERFLLMSVESLIDDLEQGEQFDEN